MDKAEIQQIAGLLVECHEGLCGWDGTDTMMLCLHRLHEVIDRISNAAESPQGRWAVLPMKIDTVSPGSCVLREQLCTPNGESTI